MLGHPLICAVCADTDRILWDAFEASSDPVEFRASKLLFPRYRKNSLRISEQEARFAFVQSLFHRNLSYSVETPTIKLYSFSGSTPMSAQTDLTVYQMMDDGNQVNIEFKAHGISVQAKNHFNIRKDLEKLLREPAWGCWFHIFKAVDGPTIMNLLTVIVQEICKACKNNSDIDCKGLLSIFVSWRTYFQCSDILTPWIFDRIAPV